MITFSDELWPVLAPRVEAIMAHPFLAGLLDGSLPGPAFEYYVVQDAHYLRDYARALAITAAKATDDDSLIGFSQDAADAIVVERSLHEGFLSELGAVADTVPVQPTTLAYTSYLLRTAYQGSFAEAVAVVLPCYWIYARVGAALLAGDPSPDARYRRWIETYGGEAFQTTVRRVLDTVDRLGPELSVADRARFVSHVERTAQYEWLFFDAAWRGEQWPAQVR